MQHSSEYSSVCQGTIHTIQSKAADFPDILRHIHDPPQQLYVCCNNWPALNNLPCIAVVGSRKASSYGKAVTSELVRALAQGGVAVVSGLAFGIDAHAHRTALASGGATIAVLAGGLDAIYPDVHRSLAAQIVEQGGALISEYPIGTPPLKSYFVARNRLVSGLSQAVLITEAAEKSGTLHTARFALDQGRDVLVVPGNITSAYSAGTNNLLRRGATPILSAADLLQTLGIKSASRSPVKGGSPAEQAIIDLLAGGETDGNALLRVSGLEVREFNQALTMLEISGKVHPLGGNQWSL
jgi:DNA processing protein